MNTKSNYNGVEKDKIIETISNRDEALKKYMEIDPKWAETQKAAVQFGVPIVIIDRAKNALKESEKINNLVQQFEKTKDDSLIEQIIVEFENNRTACREYHTNLEETFFSNEKIEGYLNKIVKTINTEINEGKLTEKYDKLKTILNKEIEKRENFHKTKEDEIHQFWIEKVEEINGLEQEQVTKLSKAKDKTELKDIIENIEHKDANGVPEIKDDIYREIIDMKSMGLYEGKKIHSERHIQNVMLFSSILGEKYNLNEQDMQLLIESAKFHDSGRDSDNDRNHAEPSAIIAGEILNDKYDETDLKIIQIAVEYHEARESEKGKLDDRILCSLFKKYELNEKEEARTKTICEILKDADALDRTRFVGRAKLDKEYLHSEEAKGLTDFATQINEHYAKNDLTKYCVENDGIEESIHRYMEDNNADYLYTIRAIRKGYFVPVKDAISSAHELKENFEGISSEEVIKTEKSMISIKDKSRNHKRSNPNRSNKNRSTQNRSNKNSSNQISYNSKGEIDER